MNSRLENMDFHEVLFILKKHVVLIIASIFLFGTAGFAVSKIFIPPQYQAEAKLIVNASSSSNSAAEVYNAVQLSQKEVDTYAIIIKNNTILNNVISDLNLNITKEELAKKIDIEGIGTTEVLDLKVRDEDTETAKAIASHIIRLAPDEIIRTVKAGSVEVISQPETNNIPVSPNVKLYTAVASIAGLILSLLAALLKELLNNTFSSDEDVQKYLGFTVIGVIPDIEAKGGVRSK